MEELASAGEELLERVLKGDCLKRSSRKGLEENVMQEPSSCFHFRAGNRKTVAAGIGVSAHLVMPNDVLSLFSLALLTFSATQKHKRALGLSWCFYKVHLLSSSS